MFFYTQWLWSSSLCAVVYILDINITTYVCVCNVLVCFTHCKHCTLAYISVPVLWLIAVIVSIRCGDGQWLFSKLGICMQRDRNVFPTTPRRETRFDSFLNVVLTVLFISCKSCNIYSIYLLEVGYSCMLTVLPILMSFIVIVLWEVVFCFFMVALWCIQQTIIFLLCGFFFFFLLFFLA